MIFSFFLTLYFFNFSLATTNPPPRNPSILSKPLIIFDTDERLLILIDFLEQDLACELVAAAAALDVHGGRRVPEHGQVILKKYLLP